MPKSLSFSERGLKTPASPIRVLSPLAQKAKAAGKTVYHLNIGQPDIKTPVEFWDGIRKFQQPVLAYELSEGNTALRKSWATFMNRSLTLNVAPEQLLITTGASEALIFIFMVCSDPGSEVVIFDPTYANYIGFAAVAGVNLVPVPGMFEANYALPDDQKIEQVVTEKTRAILLCNPNNPTGTVYTKGELTRLLALCQKHNLFLVVDETYREFVYEGIAPLSILHIAPNDPRVIVVDSLSKRFSLCGARIGAIISSNEQLLALCLNLAQARLASPTLEQYAAAYMLDTISPDFITTVRSEYLQRRDTLVAALRSLNGVEMQTPQGAFYLIARLPVDDAGSFARFLLNDFDMNRETVFIAPAQGFFMQQGRGKTEARIAYVLQSAELIKAVVLLGQGIEEYGKKTVV